MFKQKERPQTLPTDESGLSWEADIVSNLRSSRQYARILAAGLFVLTMILAIAIVVMLPLRKVVPYPFVVDRLTGEARPITTVDEYVSTNSLHEKNWVMQFVIARERYSYRLLQHDYDQVRRMSGPQVWTEYDKQFDGAAALDKRYGENVEVIPAVVSITLADGGLATVRYELRTRDHRASAEPTVSRRVATLRFKYEPRTSVSEAEAIKNPLGMTVVGYQSDPELLTTDGGKP